MIKTLLLAGATLAFTTVPALAQMTTPVGTAPHATTTKATHAKMTVTHTHTVTRGPAYHLRQRVVHHRHHVVHHAAPAMKTATHTESTTKTMSDQTKM